MSNPLLADVLWTLPQVHSAAIIISSRIDAMQLELHKRALLLSYFTVGYNILEGAVSILAGLMAGSIALFGFGLDSVISLCVDGEPNRPYHRRQ